MLPLSVALTRLAFHTQPAHKTRLWLNIAWQQILNIYVTLTSWYLMYILRLSGMFCYWSWYDWWIDYLLALAAHDVRGGSNSLLISNSILCNATSRLIAIFWHWWRSLPWGCSFWRRRRWRRIISWSFWRRRPLDWRAILAVSHCQSHACLHQRNLAVLIIGSVLIIVSIELFIKSQNQNNTITF